MISTRQKTWIRLFSVYAFAAAFVGASFLGSTHFHFADLPAGDVDIQNVGAACSCTLHLNESDRDSEQKQHQDAPGDSDNCPICKLLAEMSANAIAADDPGDQPFVCFGQFETPSQVTFRTANPYFVRGPPADC